VRLIPQELAVVGHRALVVALLVVVERARAGDELVKRFVKLVGRFAVASPSRAFQRRSISSALRSVPSAASSLSSRARARAFVAVARRELTTEGSRGGGRRATDRSSNVTKAGSAAPRSPAARRRRQRLHKGIPVPDLDEPGNSSRFSASRTTWRFTPSVSASSRSVGSFDPAGIAPARFANAIARTRDRRGSQPADVPVASPHP
jgi:hypothetical protein